MSTFIYTGQNIYFYVSQFSIYKCIDFFKMHLFFNNHIFLKYFRHSTMSLRRKNESNIPTFNILLISLTHVTYIKYNITVLLQ